MLAYRSSYVEQPHTYGTWGGAIDPNESVIESLKREIVEETKYTGKVEFIPLYVFKKDNFRYYNYLAIVDHEFIPKLDWENDGYEWCDLDDLPSPLHFGMKSILNDASSIKVLEKFTK